MDHLAECSGWASDLFDLIEGTSSALWISVRLDLLGQEEIEMEMPITSPLVVGFGVCLGGFSEVGLK